MDQTADALKHDIEHRRQQMTEDVQELEHRAKSMMDWRQQISERPMAALGVAAAGGLLIGMLTGGSSDKSRMRSGSQHFSYQPTPNYSRFAGEGNGHDERQSGIAGWVSGERGPSQATDAGKQRAASKVDEIRGALMGLAATKAEEFLKEALPGFKQEVEKVKTSDSGGHDVPSAQEHTATATHANNPTTRSQY